jgi:hypothetical protein
MISRLGGERSLPELGHRLIWLTHSLTVSEFSGYWPVNNVARAGAQTGWFVNAERNSVPRCPIASGWASGSWGSFPCSPSCQPEIDPQTFAGSVANGTTPF